MYQMETLHSQEAMSQKRYADVSLILMMQHPITPSLALILRVSVHCQGFNTQCRAASNKISALQ